MKIATWNVNSIRARKERLHAWLESRNPDVLCLQETKVQDDLFPGAEIAEAGYQVAFHGQKTYNGVAILSKEPASDVVRGFGDGGDDTQARLIAGTVAGIKVISVYVPNGKEVGTDKYEYKLEWLRRLRTFLDRYASPADPMVLTGDFNVAPDDRDVYDPEGWQGSILCSDPERHALRKVVEWGFVDAFRQHHEEGGLYSWWDYRRLGFPKNRGLRIDHVYITRPLIERCSDVSIDRDERKGKGPSDHAPVVATFD